MSYNTAVRLRSEQRLEEPYLLVKCVFGQRIQPQGGFEP
jgi:hypothetical protein